MEPLDIEWKWGLTSLTLVVQVAETIEQNNESYNNHGVHATLYMQ